jgi:hypothetical protein
VSQLNDHYDHPVADPQHTATEPRRRRPPVLLVVAGALAVVTAVTWAAGGLRARPGGPIVAKPGSVVSQGLFDVQVMDARAGRMKLGEFDPLANLLVVRMRVTNRGGESYGVSSFVGGVAAEPHPGSYLQADIMRSQGDIQGEVTTSIDPRLPVVLQVVWPLGNATAPSTVTLALRKWEYGQSFTTDTFYWSVTKQSPITAKVSVPVHAGATS